MAFEDTHCVCGGRKLTDTLLCAACVQASHPGDLATFNEGSFSSEARRSAAIRLLAAARRRKNAPKPKAPAVASNLWDHNGP